MDDCLFCKIAKGDIPSEKVFENNDFLAFLDINPVNPGHILLIPKSHYKDLYDMPDNILSKAGPLIKRLSIALKKSLDANGINLAMNNESGAGQEIFHAHFHIMPRFEGDSYKLWHGMPYEREGLISETAEKIRKEID